MAVKATALAAAADGGYGCRVIIIDVTIFSRISYHRISEIAL